MVSHTLDELGEKWPLYIDGELREGGARPIDVIDPCVNEKVAEVPTARLGDIETAFEGAQRSFSNGTWSVDAPERGRTLLRIAGLLRKNSERLALLESIQTGRPIRESRGGIAYGASYFEYFGGLADKIQGETIPGSGKFSYTTREPYGVISHIVPWNAPFGLMSRGVGPALAYGNTVVVKAPSLAPLTCVEFGRICEEAEVPRGVVNVVVGSGEDVGSLVVQHRYVRKVVFTGSVGTGGRVMRLASERLTPVLLELGGKAPFIVLKDSDLEEAIDFAMQAFFWGTGQVCFAGTRLFVEREVADEFTSEFIRRVQRIRTGMSTEEETEMGPLISKKHLGDVEAYVKAAVSEGARILTGGERLKEKGFERGNFFLPTVLTDVRNDMRVCQEEIFGPVVPVMRFDSTDEMIRSANGVEYGLSAYLCTNDLRRAYEIIPKLQTGMVSVYAYGAASNIPIGGYKSSGIGREAGIHAIEEYTQLKSVNISLKRVPRLYKE